MTLYQYSSFSQGSKNYSGSRRIPNGDIIARLGDIKRIDLEYKNYTDHGAYFKYFIFLDDENNPPYYLFTTENTLRVPMSNPKFPCHGHKGAFERPGDLRKYLSTLHLNDWQDEYGTKTFGEWSLCFHPSHFPGYPIACTHGYDDCPEDFNRFLSIIDYSVEELMAHHARFSAEGKDGAVYRVVSST